MIDGKTLYSELGHSGSKLIVCPSCSHLRSKLHRKTKVLRVSRTVEGDGILYFCHHCSEHGSYFPDGQKPQATSSKTKKFSQSEIWKHREKHLGKKHAVK